MPPSEVMYESPKHFRYPVESEFALKIPVPRCGKRFAAEKPVDKGAGERQEGSMSDSRTGSSPSIPSSRGTSSSATDGLRAQEGQRVARNVRVDRIAQTAGFVENEIGGRQMALPEVCHQSSRPGGCMRGNSCRYARSDIEFRPLKDMTHHGKKVWLEALRSGRVDFSIAALPSNADEIVSGYKNSIRFETPPPLGGENPQEGDCVTAPDCVPGGGRFYPF